MVDTNSESSSAADVDISALSPGAMIGRYEVLAVLGQGSFGITYRARDVQLNREVAIKEYLPTTLAYRQAGAAVLPRSTRVAEDFTWGRDRFVAESRVMASLHHAPGVVRVHDFLEVNGTAYIVMEMLHGDTLEGHIKKHGRLDAPAIERIIWPLLEGLEQVHDAGFLHRDVKPANILLNAQGRPTLIDFGASRAAMAGRTVAMTAVFTPGYAAAEQFNMAKQGPWTDIYGVAATLYHAICGEAPPSAFERMLDDEYQPVGRRALAGFPPGLLAGIDAGLAVRAADRPQSIAAWREILSSTAAPGDEATKLILEQRPDPAATVVMGRPVAPSQASPPQPSAPPAPQPSGAPRNRSVLYAGAAVALLGLAGGGYLLLAPKPAPQVAAAAGPPPVAVQDLNVEELERILVDRRKADAAAAEKRRLEQEAQSKADDGTASKKAADEELERVQQQRQKAEEELAKLKAEMEERRQAIADQREQADAETRRAAEARHAAEEAAQRKAEAETAALRQAEAEAKRKAEAEAAAKQQADEALARAQAERQRADDEAKAKAEAEARQKADAEATLENERKAGEAAEAALRLALLDRQHVQIALTALGFDTRGSDGVFGPRSREMIASWQKARNLPPTGFLDAAQNQALLKETAAAITRYDAEQKRIEEERKRAEDRAKAKPVVATPAPATPAPAAPAPAVPAAAAPAPTPDAPPAPAPAQRPKIRLSQ